MIYDQLKAKKLEYMKAKDSYRLEKLRYVLSQIQNKEIELRAKGEEITDELVFKIIRKQVKNRNQAIEIYEKAGEADRVEDEKKEKAVLEEFAAMFPFELNLNPGRPQK